MPMSWKEIADERMKEIRRLREVIRSMEVEKNNSVILVYVSGGVVTGVEGIPDEVIVEVHDFDSCDEEGNPDIAIYE